MYLFNWCVNRTSWCTPGLFRTIVLSITVSLILLSFWRVASNTSWRLFTLLSSFVIHKIRARMTLSSLILFLMCMLCLIKHLHYDSPRLLHIPLWTHSIIKPVPTMQFDHLLWHSWEIQEPCGLVYCALGVCSVRMVGGEGGRWWGR